MRRQKSEKVTTTFSRSGVIDFKEGFMENDSVEHLPTEAIPLNQEAIPLNKEAIDLNVETAESMLDKARRKAKELKEYVREKLHKSPKPEKVMQAQQHLNTLTHLEATQIQDLVAADVNAFSTKYLAAFSSDAITQAQLDTMVSLGTDVYNNSMCTHIQQSSTYNAPLTSQKPRTKVSSKTPVYERSFHREEVSQESMMDKKYSLRELQPKLEKAVNETLSAYGIDGSDVDTKQKARMSQLEALLRT